VAVIGDGSFAGGRALLSALALPLDVPHLPALLALVTLPCDPGAAIVDVDGQLSALSRIEGELEDGSSSEAARRLGVASTTMIAVPSPLRLRVGKTMIALHDNDGVCVVDVD
jgi:hypothetical protein